MSQLLHVLLLSLLPMGATMFGAALSVWRSPSARVQSALQHFAAGVVLSVVGVELLPDVMRAHETLATILGFTAGIATLLVLRQVTGEPPRGAGDAAAPVGSDPLAPLPRVALPRAMLVALGVDILLDGLLLGTAFAAGNKEGLLLLLGLSLELISLALAVAAGLAARGLPRKTIVGVLAALSALVPFGAGLGDTVLHNAAPPALIAVLSFGCAALLFLVVEELLIDAHETPETPATTALFFAGFLGILMLSMLG